MTVEEYIEEHELDYVLVNIEGNECIIGYDIDEDLEEKFPNYEYLIEGEDVYYCSGCGEYHYKYRNEPIVLDGELYCGDYIKEELAEEYLEDIENDYMKCNQLLNLEDYGYTLVMDNLENGLYGTVDSPKEIYEKLSDKYDSIVFNLTDSNPFAVYFNVYAK